MNWVVAGVGTGVAAWLVDFVLWTKVFTKGMDQFATPPAAGQRVAMGPKVAGSLALALVFGVVFAGVYLHFRASLWASGGAFSDFLIHNIDECCWIKNAWPVEAKASGGLAAILQSQFVCAWYSWQ
jgi:hypothetical protein